MAPLSSIIDFALWASTCMLIKSNILLAETEFNFKLVQVVFRHGDRSAIHPYENDPYQEDSWPQGLGELSKLGQKQAYNLGVFLRNRYMNHSFLNSSFIQKEIYVRSTDYDRTLMTAQSVLAGLYPPSMEEALKPNIQWQPIPVHTKPVFNDAVMHMSINCPKFEQIHRDYIENNPRYQNITLTNQDLINTVANFSGNEATLSGLISVVDPLFCEHTHNFSLPTWVTENNLYDKILPFSNLGAEMFLPTLEMARLKGGMLLDFMVQKMKNKTENGNMTEKMFMYSGHDTTVNAVLSSLQIFNKLKVPYRACVMIELVETAPNVYSVQIFYRNDTTHQPYPLAIPGCDHVCPFEKFIQLTKRGIPDDIYKECALDSSLSSSKLTIAITVISCVLLLIFLVIAVICFLRIRNRRVINYRMLSSDAI